MAIALILDTNGYIAQIAEGVSLQADKLDRKATSGNLAIGASLGAEELQLGSSSSLVRVMGDAEIDGYIELLDTSAPTNPGAGRGRLYKKTGDDGVFWLPDAAGAEVDLTDKVSEANHRLLDTLTHELDEDYYEEYTYSGNYVSADIVWTDSGKTTKIREYTYTYDTGKMVGSVEKQYNGSGTLVETLTKTYTWTGSKLTSVTCVRS